jgi:hypothetical protein
MKDENRRVKPSHAVMPEEDDEDSIEAVDAANLKKSETALEKNQLLEMKQAQTGPEKMDDDMGK